MLHPASQVEPLVYRRGWREELSTYPSSGMAPAATSPVLSGTLCKGWRGFAFCTLDVVMVQLKKSGL